MTPDNLPFYSCLLPLERLQSPSSGSGQTPLYDLQQVLILQCGPDPFFVVQLLIDCVLALVRARFDS